ncbi:MAG: hypothetical protein ACXVBY_02070, partial [Isosphaeraceae bacterium]
YVLYVADIRREGSIPDSGFLEDGLLKTLPGVKPVSSAPAQTPEAAPATTRSEPRPRGATALVVR